MENGELIRKVRQQDRNKCLYNTALANISILKQTLKHSVILTSSAVRELFGNYFIVINIARLLNELCLSKVHDISGILYAKGKFI